MMYLFKNFQKRGKMLRKIYALFLLLQLAVIPLISQEGIQKPYLVLNNPSDSGMFAVFSSVVGALNVYESGDYAGLHIDLNSGRYLDPTLGNNWWEYFFEPIKLGDEKNAYKYFFTLDDYLGILTQSALPPIARAHELIQKYIHVKPEIQVEVDAFCNQYTNNYFTIGVHHRGTDKFLEWPLIPYENTLQVIYQVINVLPPEMQSSAKVFVATDETAFIDFLMERIPERLVFNNFSRSSDGTPLHEYNTQFFSKKYLMTKEPLLDCLMLSKCHFLIRPMSSCLSSVSKWFNPSIYSIDL